MPEKDLESAREAALPVLTLQSQLLDRASMLVMKAVLPTSLHLDTLRLCGCSLDIELLQLLRESFTSDTTVRNLQVEWNRVELALDDKIRESLSEVHHWTEIDEAEKSLFISRAQRSLMMFREELEFRQGGDLKSAVQRLAEHAVKGHPVTSTLWPMDINSWVSAFYDVFHMDVLDCEPIFNILDSDYGDGDGFVPLTRLLEVLEGLPAELPANEERLLPPAQHPEFQDEIGSAFAAFLDRTSPLEVISFRCCNLARLEIQAISSCLASPSPHLRALNLWGNKICDRGAQALALALEFNFGLQFLGLGRNFVTQEGLRALCSVLGTRTLEDKASAEKVIKHLKDQQKDIEKKRKAFGAPPKDGNGRERYWPEPHLDTCEELKDDSGTPYWTWTRNTTIKTLNVEQNPIADADVIEQLQPFGTGALILRSTPCAPRLLDRQQQKAKEQEQLQKEMAGEDEAEGVDESSKGSKGWKLILT
ncbi:Scn11a [Symbiodinium natans]|uniref:Scn11a protein n=1 Tax=Symbiodinium natans TaxID=878477 RepID=A0A812S7T6_9DINO|nr:Scn11a [Symbiodinium natans]